MRELVPTLLALAGACCLTASAIHSLLGERRVVQPIVARMDWSGLPIAPWFARRLVRLAWHVTSVTWAGFAVILLSPVLGLNGTMPVYLAAMGTFAVAFLMTGPGTSWRHKGWPIFALITLALGAAVVLLAS